MLWGGLVFFLGFFQIARADSIPDSASITGFVGHPQNFSLSCEARSAVDWMAFWGIYISESDFLSLLPRSDNPDRGFVGYANDMWGSIPPHSYGVHAEPVAALLQAYGFDVEAQRDFSWDDLRLEIAAGRPVIVWVIGQMWPGTPRPYSDEEGHNTIVASFEHTMVMTGYDESSVTVVDASTGFSVTYNQQDFLTSWSVLGNMAVTGEMSDAGSGEGAPPDSTYAGKTYIVQHGDYLMALADRFGMNWQELADLNGIRYPYTIYPGQVLEIPGGEAPPEEPQPQQPTLEPSPVPTLEPTPAPTLVPRLLKPEEIRTRMYMPVICQNCQPTATAKVIRGRPRSFRGR